MRGVRPERVAGVLGPANSTIIHGRLAVVPRPLRGMPVGGPLLTWCNRTFPAQAEFSGKQRRLSHVRENVQRLVS